jgi:thymidylate kinase
VPIAYHRLVDDKGLKYYGAGLDLGLSPSKEESCAKYESMMDKIYKQILPKEPNYHILDTNRPIDDTFADIRKTLADKFCIGVGKHLV